MKWLLYAATALVVAFAPLSVPAQAGSNLPGVISEEPARPKADAEFQITEQTPIDPSCRRKAPGEFNPMHEYTCAYQLFRAFSMPLADAAKRAEFDALWAPDKVKDAPELKSDGVSEDDRKSNTFALIRRMRDFTHERFDFVHDPVQQADIQKNIVHPVLDGGIGAILRLNNMWEIQKSILDGLPEGGITYGEYQKRLDEKAIIGPGHELVIDATVPESPSAGVLKPGDIITHVIDKTGEHALDGLSQSAAIKLIRGDLGSTVTLKVLRKNSAGRLIPLSLRLQRVQVQQRAVVIHDVDGIRHIRVENFTNDYLLVDFYNALTEAQKLGMKGVVVDVRGNPGGRMDYVVGMLQMVTPRGLILTVRQRNPGAEEVTQTEWSVADGYAITAVKPVGAPDSEKKIETAQRVPFSLSYAQAAMRNPGLIYEHPLLPVIAEDMPVVVLADTDSYSASEIFAGSVQATRRGIVVGQPTAGKGAIMISLPLPEGGGLDVTNGQFYPGGMDTKHKGVIADRIVENVKDYGKTDAQMDAADAAVIEAWKHREEVNSLATKRTTINDQRFEDDMAKRDANDLKPPKEQDPRYQQ